MIIEKSLGIWMDHQNAHVMEFTTDPIATTTVESKFTHQEKEQTLGRSENLMHNKEQHEELREIIRNYNDVILFGPTDAKLELLNILRKDHLFADIVIEVKSSDKMTENQQHAFVREYFSKRLFLI
jgi:hypothetical protein